jgi:teichuronic acid biosynthesis glycosyltransferase TuaG
MQFNDLKNPIVSIIMNCYNGEDFLKEALTSISNQTYKNYELIFIDNCSTDHSAEVFYKYKPKKYKYIKTEKKLKLYDARNIALKNSTGEVLTFLDTDDIWNSNKLENQVSYLEESSNVGVVYSYCEIYDYNNKKKKIQKPKFSKDITNHLLKDYDISLVSIALRKQILDNKNIMFNSNYNLIGDFDLIIRLSLHCNFSIIKKNLCTYRVHNKSETSTNYSALISEMREWYNVNLYNKDLYKKKNFHLIEDKILYFECIEFLKTKKFKSIFMKLGKFSRKFLLIKILIKTLLAKFYS